MTRPKKTATSNARSATYEDKALGLKIRTARNGAGLSQAALGDVLGITFQQVQKYEKGVNRVSGHRLNVIAQTTGRPLSYFIEDAGYKPGSKGEKISEFAASRMGSRLLELMVDMRPDMRERVVDVARSLSRAGLEAA